MGDVYGVAADGEGNVYVADPVNRVVFKIAPDETLSVVAGNGSGGFSGDGGLANSVSLSCPCDVNTDATGNLCILDGSTVRKVTKGGIITTVAGGGSFSGVGDGKRATEIQRLTYCANGIALDRAGNLYIGELFANRVRKVSLDGIITTVSGNGTQGSSGDGGPATEASLALPTGVAVDSIGNFVVVPKGVAAGDAVPVVLSVEGQDSPVVTMAVK